MRVIVGLFLVCNLLAASFGQSSSFTVTNVAPVDVGLWTDYSFVVANSVPQSSISITLTEDVTTSLTFSGTQMQFGPTTQAASFRVKSNDAGTFGITFTVSGDAAGQYPATFTTAVSFNLRTTAIDFFPSPVLIAQPSEPIKLYIKTPSTSALTFVPTPDNTSLSISGPIVIPAGELSTSFTFISSDLLGTMQIAWDIRGDESALYADGLTGYYDFQIIQRSVFVPQFSGEVLLSADSTSLYVYTPLSVNNSLTVTPQAADTTFYPSSFQFYPDAPVAQFNFTTTTPSTSKPVFFYLSGQDQNLYANPGSSYLNIPKRLITVTTPVSFVLTNTSYLSISLTAPAVSSVTVSLYAANVNFNTSSVTFSGNQTTFAVAIYPFALGEDTISFLVSGNDVDYYETIDSVTVSIGGGQFFGPADWYVPYLWVGVESDPIPVRASWSPINNVTLTMSAPDVRFNPPSLTFRNGSEQQYFTITPLYVNNDDTYPQITVTFLVSGPDYTFFDAPTSFTVNVMRRTVQMTWSAHLYDTTRHLGKTYEVWAAANYVTKSDLFSVTPVSPYFSFNPPVLQFNADTTRIRFEATVTGIVGSTEIDYVIGGRDGGWYTAINTDAITTAIRPFYLWSAVLAPDNRVGGNIYVTPTSDEIIGNHIYSFVLYSPILPNSLTVTPKCNHASFSPSSHTFSASQAITMIDQVIPIGGYYYELPGLVMQMNFTVNWMAGGTHEMWFELSGNDAPFYDNPGHQFITFRPVLRASPEPQQGSGSYSTRLVPSLLVIFCVFLSFMML